MRYTVKHTTKYEYEKPVSVCYNAARLTPPTSHSQTCLGSTFRIHPHPQTQRSYVDAYGNHVMYFELSFPHSELVITSESQIELISQSQQELFQSDTPWDEVVQQLDTVENAGSVIVQDFRLPSPLVPIVEGIEEYALESFTPKRPLIEATNDLMRRIFEDFKYDPSFTTISTPLQKVLKHKKGVCQDFSHLAIACLRSLRLSACYVSGYIETLPPEGEEKLEGADASHAWFSIYSPNVGWIDFDPTNNLVPNDQHITVARGRDFSDVTPLKGVIYGGGSHELSVAVDVRREEGKES